MRMSERMKEVIGSALFLLVLVIAGYIAMFL